MKHITRYLSLFLTFAAIICLASCGGAEKKTAADKKTAAHVGEYDVSEALYSYFTKNYEAQYTGGTEVTDEGEREALDKKIAEDAEASVKKLYALYAAAAEHGIVPGEVTASAVEAYIAQFRAENALGDDDAFTAALEERHMSYEVFRTLAEKQALETELYEKLCGDGTVKNTAEAVRSAAEGGELIRVRHILIRFDDGELNYRSIINPELLKETSSYKKAEEAARRLSEGADFDSLIGEYGNDISLFGNGDGHYIAIGNKEIPYEKAAFSLAEGEISGIVETSEGFCIIKRLPTEEEYLEKNSEALIKEYTEGQFNIIIENKADALTFEYVK